MRPPIATSSPAGRPSRAICPRRIGLMTTSSQSPSPQPRRSEVWLVAYEPIGQTVGREQAGPRPALVISVDAFNDTSGLVLAVPITRSRPITHLPIHLSITPPDGGLQYEITLLCEQVRSLSQHRFLRRLGQLSEAHVEAVVLRLRSLI